MLAPDPNSTILQNAFSSPTQLLSGAISEQAFLDLELDDAFGCVPYDTFPFAAATALIDTWASATDIDGSPRDIGHLGGPGLNAAYFGADQDQDSVRIHLDCDDQDAAVSPLLPEQCDGVDTNCDGNIDEDGDTTFFDADNDGWGTGSGIPGCAQPGWALVGGDCDDSNEQIYPNATELCNQIDDDCDGTIDNDAVAMLWYADDDGDGFGDGTAISSCGPPGPHFTMNHTDCDDTDGSINPDAPEQCDSIDHNCNGPVDDGVVELEWFPDADSDGFGGGTAVLDCAPVPGHTLTSGDCDDADALINPNADEVCDTIDNDCDGDVDDDDMVVGAPRWYADLDNDSFGDDLVWIEQCLAPPEHVDRLGDCNDLDPNIYLGAPEACADNKDNDCDGLIDADDPDFSFAGAEYGFDADGDGYGNPVGTINACSGEQPAGYVSMTNGDDCDDAVSTTHPHATEICNAIDDDCEAGPDNGLLFLDYFVDADADGFGDPSSFPINACLQPPNTSGNALDCDDADPLRNPFTLEICNGIDEDCDQIVDNHLPTVAYFPDVDADGYGDRSASPIDSCEPVPGLIPENTDCNDLDATIHPGAAEVPDDGIDSDCDGAHEQIPVPVVDTDGDGIPDAIDGDPLRSSTDQTVDPSAPAFGCGCSTSALGASWVPLLPLLLALCRRR